MLNMQRRTSQRHGPASSHMPQHVGECLHSECNEQRSVDHHLETGFKAWVVLVTSRT